MGTEILHPQDCLVQRIRLNHHHPHHHQHNPSFRKSYYAGNSTPKSCRKSLIRPEQQKRRIGVSPAVQSSSNDLVMGKVKILKRGEKNEILVKRNEDLIVPRRICVTDEKLDRSEEVYAGSAFFMSPSPRALPLPTFSKKEGLVVVDDYATNHLRQLLGLY